ncbi:unnamed protein product [Withania somnifera]
MGSSQGVISLANLLIISTIVLFGPLVMVNGDFSDNMYINWGSHHSWMQGNECQLVLDQSSGSGVQSKGTFLFGSIEMQIKLVPGNSAGTVTAYYLSSIGDKHDEIDYEFLGNVSGQPYVIHTNIFAQGGGGREQQFYPWFDPTADYHNYTIHWNPNAVVVQNYRVVAFPIQTHKLWGFTLAFGMLIVGQLEVALSKLTWTNAPFVAKYRNFVPRTCPWNGPVSINHCAAQTPANCYAKQGQMDWVRNRYMIYDYCKDTKRFNGQFPGECFKPQF